MEKYQSYKPSGVEWIGEIPEHWETIRFGMLGIFSSSGIDKKLDDNETSVRMVNYTDIIKSRVHNPIINNQIDFMVVTTPQSKLVEHKLRKGDLVFLPSSETCEDLGVSSLIDFDENDIVYSYHILRFKFLKEVNHYFKKYRGNHNGVYNQFSLEGKGTTRQIIGRNVFRNVKVVLPPISEQHQIVQFLDEKTVLIDELILTKERKITLLKEQRTSLINQVVTKGLNPNVKMKDSGVEWIGETPEHWKISKLGFYTTKIGSGSTPKGGSEIYPDSGIPFIRSQNVHFNGLRLNDVSFIDFDTHKSMKGSKVIKNDVLLNITGGSIGRCCIVEVEGEMNVNQHVSIIRTTLELVNYFLNYILSSDLGQSQVLFNLTGGNREGLTIDGIRNFRITIPPMKEQLQMVQHLNFKTKEIDDLVQLEQKKIDLLKEYRQSLISEVVTGKIKVTN